MNKNILAIGIVFLFVCSAFIPMSLGINTRITNTREQPSTFSRGETLYVGGTGDGNYTKIQDAIDNASDGDTVYVYDDSSPYYENVNVNKRINLIGEDRDTTVIDGGGSGGVICITAEWVNVSAFTLQEGRHGLSIQNLKHTNIYNNIIGKDCSVGIFMARTSFHSIVNNIIQETNMFGIELVWTSYAEGPCNYNIIINNIIQNNGNKGIQLAWGSHNVISGNTIKSQNYGIYIWETHSTRYNIIYHNNFLDNVHNAQYSGSDNLWDNGYPSGGNYWDDYTGEDNDGDGIGDTPYNIPDGGNKDFYPLMELWDSDNNPPHVEITYPSEGDIVWDTITVNGTAHDDDGDETLELVKLKVDNGEWVLVDGTTSWSYIWDTTTVSNGQHKIFVRSYDGELYSVPDCLGVIVDNSPLQADANGEYYGIIHEPVKFHGSASGGWRPYSWLWDFGDGNYSDEQNPIHNYTHPGTFIVTLTVTDDLDNVTNDTTWAWIQVSNDPPDKPTIDGPTRIDFWKTYKWTFTAIDPESTYIWYYIKWGDGKTSGWRGPYDSGENITLEHAYIQWLPDDPTSYTIKAKAKDPYNTESDWAELKVTMPRNRATYNSLFLKLLEQFPILERLLSLIRV